MLRAELGSRLDEIDDEYAGRSPFAKNLAVGPVQSSLAELSHHYGEAGLNAHSHGESFLELFQARFRPGGLHLIDEPEAALSPQSQRGLLAMLKDLVK